MKKYIPDCVTLLNLVCGTCACIIAMRGHWFAAFIFVLGAAAADFLDGFCARLLKASSPLGKQLDSLCDLVSFGLAPALMIFNWQITFSTGSNALAYFAFIYVCCAALRLARFNIDESQKVDFKGLAVPGGAMIVAPMLAYGEVCTVRGFDSFLVTMLNSWWFLPVLSAILGGLMVSRVGMFSLKGKRLSLKDYPREAVHFASVLLLACPLAITKGTLLGVGFFYAAFPLILLFTFVLYILVNLAAIGTHRS